MFEKKNIDKELKNLEEDLEKETNWDDYEKINKNLKKKKLPFKFYQITQWVRAEFFRYFRIN